MKIVILAGGYGTRLWPLSRKSMPKPFIKLVNGKSFFQITYARYRKTFNPEDIFVVTEEGHIPFVRNQAPEIPRKNIVVEPERKDILAACGLATAIVHKYFPGDSILISWSKHLISKESVFLNAVTAAGEYADSTGLIVSVDSKPEYPSVHNGWVKLGKTLGKINGFKIQQIERHVEKPKAQIANKLFKEGGWLINTGFRVWKSDTMLGYYEKYQPEMYKGLMAIADAWGTKNQKKVLKREYKKFVSESIEYGIFEKLPGDVRGTIAADMGWEDAGISWELFYQALKTTSKDNVIEGGADTEILESKNNLVIAPKGKIIGLIGVQNLVIIDTPDGLLVCDMHQTQRVKDLYALLEEKNSEYTT